ncbi:hypoxanthine phosphoribosyltransferase [Candidatus Woesearchaeota archaeon B3_Woes]|nr:MAG: hypoxanthine phosphoribosyltransferase [Candidatus Woesearchaeota archaeon B3_Woes]
MGQFEVLISQEEIADLVNGLAQEIVKNHQEQFPLYLVTVLNGARTFSDDLQKRILGIQSFEIVDYEIKLSSYGNSTESSRDVEIVKYIEENVEGLDLIIVEDIVDTGLTLDFLKNYLLNEKGAHSVRICSLLSKPSRRETDVQIDYLGREIPDKFIFGYGIDKGEQYRGLPDIVLQE